MVFWEQLFDHMVIRYDTRSMVSRKLIVQLCPPLLLNASATLSPEQSTSSLHPHLYIALSHTIAGYTCKDT